jgi:carboxyl-terminal processing protease
VAHIRITAFSQGVSNDLKQALTQAQQQGATGVILDLRNDPGGLLDEAVSTASQFLTSGDVMLEKDAQGQITHLGVKGGGVAPTIPMVVLINGGTASASEIVAGALQDAHRGTLIGETTFGTGTVLNQFGLSDGSALLLATQEWLTPNGRVIWHKGITPDVPVSLSSSARMLLPELERDMSAAQLNADADAQMQKALELLGSATTHK